MKTISVAAPELLAHLRKNREAHIMEYNEAIVGYREALVKAFSLALKQAKNGEDISHTVNVVKPQDHTKAYDTVITMLEWTADQYIDLDHSEFAKYVQDEWDWKSAFVGQTLLYK